MSQINDLQELINLGLLRSLFDEWMHYNFHTITASGKKVVCVDKDGTRTETADLTGPKGDKGDIGEPFAIYRTYTTISAMNADAANVPAGKFVCIASNTEDPDNAKLYVKNSQGSFTFLTDLSGAQGIKGDKGDEPQITAGSDGTLYVDGNLLTAIIKNAVNTFTSNEGTSSSPRTENSRWGKYAQAEYERNQTFSGSEQLRQSAYQNAEQARDNTFSSSQQTRQTAYETAEGTSSSAAGNSSRWGAYKTAEASREQAFTNAQSTRDTTWTNWFSDTLSTGVRKLWNDFWASVNSSWNGFFGTSADDANGVRKIWSTWFSGVQSAWTTWLTNTQNTWTTWFGANDSSGIRKEVNDAIDRANAASDDIDDKLTRCAVYPLMNVDPRTMLLTVSYAEEGKYTLENGYLKLNIEEE